MQPSRSKGHCPAMEAAAAGTVGDTGRGKTSLQCLLVGVGWGGSPGGGGIAKLEIQAGEGWGWAEHICPGLGLSGDGDRVMSVLWPPVKNQVPGRERP